MCGQLMEKQGHRGRHRCITTCCSILFVVSAALLVASAFLRAGSSSALAVGAVLAGVFLLGRISSDFMNMEFATMTCFQIIMGKCAGDLQAFGP